ncbi:hypothetical protein [Lysobacter auxotrophicus]|uniref:Uncharacterized protein n=1 Tax=Lysobacter auxotrophicus TaxID=2992573 RepID=A0ABM8DEL8_9GAMM|nr:hypothetical protein [Lysobacter auxotrophicus]BDU17036.1 hypothetical protein LA521A_22370 [Lysobacter auxotrophicus]
MFANACSGVICGLLSAVRRRGALRAVVSFAGDVRGDAALRVVVDLRALAAWLAVDLRADVFFKADLLAATFRVEAFFAVVFFAAVFFVATFFDAVFLEAVFFEAVFFDAVLPGAAFFVAALRAVVAVLPAAFFADLAVALRALVFFAAVLPAAFFAAFFPAALRAVVFLPAFLIAMPGLLAQRGGIPAYHGLHSCGVSADPLRQAFRTRGDRN